MGRGAPLWIKHPHYWHDSSGDQPTNWFYRLVATTVKTPSTSTSSLTQSLLRILRELRSESLDNASSAARCLRNSQKTCRARRAKLWQYIEIAWIDANCVPNCQNASTSRLGHRATSTSCWADYLSCYHKIVDMSSILCYYMRNLLYFWGNREIILVPTTEKSYNKRDYCTKIKKMKEQQWGVQKIAVAKKVLNME